MSEAPTTGRPTGKTLRVWIDLARAERQRHEPWWEANLKAYAPTAGQRPDQYGADVNTNRDFVLVERKKADLFYQRPDVTLQPTPLVETPVPQRDAQGQPALDPQTGQPVTTSALPALQAHQEILNEQLSADGVDAVQLVHQALFDVLCTAGIGFTVMGYEAVLRPAPMEVAPAQVDPVTGAERVPATVAMVPVPIHEQCFWRYVSPKQAIIPHDFRSTTWDTAPYLGYEFTLPLTPTTRQRFKLPAEFTGSRAKAAEQHFDHGSATADDPRPGPVVTGVALWYKSALFREDVFHPDHLTYVVLIDGLDEPAIHEDCPYQSLDDRGRLTPDSLRGFPMHPLSIRVMTDTAYPPSDCTMIRPLVNELNVFRTQMVQYRDAQILRWMYNTGTLPPDALQKIIRSPVGGMIGVPPEAFHGEGAIKELPHGSMPRESFASNDYIDADISRTTAIDANAAGVQSTQDQTATEAQIQAGNANARLDFERGRVLDWYVRGVTKFSTLLQRYLSVEDAAAIVGPDRAAFWDQWRTTVPAALAFTAMPDSALRVDQAVDRRQWQDLYTYLANDPWVGQGRGKLLERGLRKFHIDPTGIVNPPPPPSPQQPATSFAFKGDDVVSPQAPIVVELLQQLGFKISPQAVQQSQGLLLQQQQLDAAAAAEASAGGTPDTAHGGKLPQMASLDKHAAQDGLGMQGVGGVTPQGGARQ